MTPLICGGIQLLTIHVMGHHQIFKAAFVSRAVLSGYSIVLQALLLRLACNISHGLQ